MANSHIGGYTIHNDYSERAWQLERSGQWVKGKSADTIELGIKDLGIQTQTARKEK